jgi:hypothetical protein
VSERLIELVSKTSVLFIEYPGFESRPLRFAFGKTEFPLLSCYRKTATGAFNCSTAQLLTELFVEQDGHKERIRI